MSWKWIPERMILRWHETLLERYGGAPGMRDRSLLEGALARPQNAVAYEPENCSVEYLAALYGVALAKAHAFIDGNKRIGFAAMVTFLSAHGLILDVTEAEAAGVFSEVADGKISAEELAAWIAKNVR